MCLVLIVMDLKSVCNIEEGQSVSKYVRIAGVNLITFDVNSYETTAGKTMVKILGHKIRVEKPDTLLLVFVFDGR